MELPRGLAADKLRQLFNETDLERRWLHDELVVHEKYREPPHPRSGQPEGSVSVREDWYDGERGFLASVHYFEQPDGSVTQPDPKELVIGNDHYVMVARYAR